ncbi:MAG: hypothetical protein ACYC3Q_11410 [Gemmatimonadaceae bacterium]
MTVESYAEPAVLRHAEALRDALVGWRQGVLATLGMTTHVTPRRDRVAR